MRRGRARWRWWHSCSHTLGAWRLRDRARARERAGACDCGSRPGEATAVAGIEVWRRRVAAHCAGVTTALEVAHRHEGTDGKGEGVLRTGAEPVGGGAERGSPEGATYRAGRGSMGGGVWYGRPGGGCLAQEARSSGSGERRGVRYGGWWRGASQAAAVHQGGGQGRRGGDVALSWPRTVSGPHRGEEEREWRAGPGRGEGWQDGPRKEKCFPFS